MPNICLAVKVQSFRVAHEKIIKDTVILQYMSIRRESLMSFCGPNEARATSRLVSLRDKYLCPFHLGSPGSTPHTTRAFTCSNFHHDTLASREQRCDVHKECIVNKKQDQQQSANLHAWHSDHSDQTNAE